MMAVETGEKTYTWTFSIYEAKIAPDGNVIVMCVIGSDHTGEYPPGWMYISLIDDDLKARATATGMTLQEAVDELNYHISTGGKHVP